MNELTTLDRQLTMSSLEIAELTGKLHRNVIADIERILDEAEIGALRFQSSYTTAQNKQAKCYNLPRRECLLIMSAYSAKLRLSIIERMDALEHELIGRLTREHRQMGATLAEINRKSARSDRREALAAFKRMR